MQFLSKRAVIHLMVAFIFAVVSGVLAITAVKAQDGVNVTVTGTLQAVNADGTIVVNGTTYKLGDGVVLPASAQVGMVVKLTGHFVNDQLIIVVIIIDTAPPTASATATPAATASGTQAAEPDVIVVVSGPVARININI